MQQHRGADVWDVDVEPIKSVIGWVRQRPELLLRDVEQMADPRNFPHWFLAVGNNSSHKFLSCSNCEAGDYIVPYDGAFRCITCGRDKRVGSDSVSLIWTGPLPVSIAGMNKIIESARLANNGTGVRYLEAYETLLVPMRVVYPTNWDNQYPLAFYPEAFFRSLMGNKQPQFGGNNHLLSGYQLCISRGGGWRKMSIYDVIRDRIAPHAVAMVYMAAGRKPPGGWFSD